MIAISTIPAALLVGNDTLGRGVFEVLGDCQKIISRPRARVITNCERLSRARATTMSIAAPRGTHEVRGNSSKTSASSGHGAPCRWQYTFAVRGHVSRARSTIPSPSGIRSR